MINKGTVLQILWTLAVWTRGLTGTAFVVSIFLLLMGADVYLDEIIYFFSPYICGSLVLHLVYFVVKLIFTKI